jgi:S-DNA-T family DNA segregation ATPase FtsK/SpoIIIE
VAVSQLVAAAALDPTAALYLLDGKLVELAAWREAADGFAGVEATALLRHIQTGMDGRYQQLLAAGRRKIGPGTGLVVVVIDELAHYMTWPDKRFRDAFGDTRRDLVSRGRAAGIIVAAATQKPSSEVIPTSLRDLSDTAGRCGPPPPRHPTPSSAPDGPPRVTPRRPSPPPSEAAGTCSTKPAFPYGSEHTT